MDWRFNTIWFDQISKRKVINWDFSKRKGQELILKDIEYATLQHYKFKARMFEILPLCKTLLYLDLTWANIIDFNGIGKFTNLKRLEVHYCTKLETDFGISALSRSLEFLHINQSKKLKSIANILKLHRLKVLCLNSCGELDNLNFLKLFPNLIDFRFVNTTILDGNLTPIIEHPSIRSVGFINKRHYNYKDTDIDNLLKVKSTGKYLDEVYKDFMTFKYKSFDEIK